MNQLIFRRKTLTWWQIALLKISILAVGIAIGTYWRDLFWPHLNILIFVGLLTGVYIGYLYLKTSNKKDHLRLLLF